MTTSAATMELTIDCGTHQGILDINDTHTVNDLRELIAEEWDEDMVPETYQFWFRGVRLSQKQETKKRAADFMDKGLTIRDASSAGVATSAKRLWPTPSNNNCAAVHAEEENPAKRAKANEKNPPPTAGAMSINTEMEVVEVPSPPTKQQQQPKDEDVVMEASTKPVPAAASDVKMAPVKPPAMKQQQQPKDEDVVMVASTKPAPAASAASDAKLAPVKPPQAPQAQLIPASPVKENETHRLHKQAIRSSTEILHKLKTIIQQEQFCSPERREEWLQEIAAVLNSSAPQTVIGVLGNTGVGKSSLLNALLEESSVLPTSGSRGCTATVVELRFHKDLLPPNKETVDGDKENSDLTDQEEKKHVYKGTVEFIKLSEWQTELKVLIDECSTNEDGTIYARTPEPERQAEAYAAWSKLNSVYGANTMERYAKSPKNSVYNRLAKHRHVVNLLTPTAGDTKENRTIVVEEGEATAAQRQQLLSGQAMKPNLRRQRKKWASAFRSKINSYVYRRGDGDGPQSWPLIRKVVLSGPWLVLRSGACLVDLPGVRDSNAARAAVAENYLRECSKILVVASIKRAVDDKTASELLGESFKRRLLMDGNYGSVSFICTQTDDIEPTETMRDHKEDAKRLPGRWEKMKDLRNKISNEDKERNKLTIQEDDLLAAVEDVREKLDSTREELAEEEDGDEEFVAQTKAAIQNLQQELFQSNQVLQEWRDANQPRIHMYDENIRILQRELKSLCSIVRNEYSTRVLKDDFKRGLAELLRADDDSGGDGTAENGTSAPPPIPDDFSLPVFCVASNEFLKIQGLKNSSDGPPVTFTRAEDTQIPNIARAVHTWTAEDQRTFTETFANTTSDLVDRIKLLASDSKDAAPGSRVSKKIRHAFDTEMGKVPLEISPLAENFRKHSHLKIQGSLAPAVKVGAEKGTGAAMGIVDSWGSKNRRTRTEKGPEKNGLYWSTYNATCRREGVYNSASAGAIDMNLELTSPVEKEFASFWQSTMDAELLRFIEAAEKMALEKLTRVCSSLLKSVSQAGLAQNRLSGLGGTAGRAAQNAVRSAFREMKQTAAASQRDLNRSLLPMIKTRMGPCYSASVGVPRGPGTFQRMKTAMHTGTGDIVQSLFTESTKELLASVHTLVNQIAENLEKIADVIIGALRSCYSVCWEENKDKVFDVEDMQKVRQCRDEAIPGLNKLRQLQNQAMETLGLERPEPEIDVMGVANFEARLQQNLKAAEEKGLIIEILDSDDDDDDANNDSKPAAVPTAKPVKQEPGLPSSL